MAGRKPRLPGRASEWRRVPGTRTYKKGRKVASERQFRQSFKTRGKTLESYAGLQRSKGTPQSQGIRRYQSTLLDYKDELARRRGYASWKEAAKKDPRFKGTRANPLNVRKMDEKTLRRRLGLSRSKLKVYRWGDVSEELSKPRSTKAQAQRFMAFLEEVLGRHVRRTWEHYLYAPGRRG